MSRRRNLVPAFIVLVLLLFGSIFLGTVFGREIPAETGIRSLLSVVGLVPAGSLSESDRMLILEYRLPRALVAALVGAGLAVAGCMMQGLFHNPMADPGILGVSAGGALGGAVAISLAGGVAGSIYHLPILAFLGAMVSSLIVYAISTSRGRTPVATLLLAGIAVNSLFSAAVSAIVTLWSPEYKIGDQVYRWLIGNLEFRLWIHVWMSAPVLIPGAILAFLLAGELNSLLLGEETAMSLGVNVGRFKLGVLILVAAMTGVCVAVSGVIAFVGLMVPHMFRLIVGPDNRVLIPACFLGGGSFLAIVDLIGRITPQEIQIGVLTSMLGAPFFLYLMIANRKKAEVF